MDTNIKGTLNVVQAARDLAVERVVHTSTSEVYGTARYVPIDEEHPLQGQSPYSASNGLRCCCAICSCSCRRSCAMSSRITSYNVCYTKLLRLRYTVGPGA